MVGYKRTDRVGDQIRVEIAEILMRRVRDPRIGFVTVTAVDLTADLKRAWVYVTVLGEEDQQDDMLAALSRASGFIRGELGRRLKLRYVPEVTFVKDTSVDRVKRVMGLLEGLQAPPEDEDAGSAAAEPGSGPGRSRAPRRLKDDGNP